MYIAILGRQPAIGMAELEKLYGAANTKWFSDQSALIDTDSFSIDHLGGTQKIGKVIFELPTGDWHKLSMKLVQTYVRQWAQFDGKITLGISAYGFDTPVRDIQKTGIVLKQKLKKNNVSLRLVPNVEPALNSATSHHNKLGLAENKVEFIAIKARSGRIVVAESRGAQNITAYTKRDQERPKRDAFVGMLPPKLAQTMINLARPTTPNGRILDPFCGTGVVLQEAALMHYPVYGTDLNEKMIRYSRDNLNWLEESHNITFDWYLHEGDATNTRWQSPVDAVVCESYLGQPFSAPPSPSKRDEVRKNCTHIIGSFLKNIAPQLAPGTPLCIAVPAWRSTDGSFTHLQLTNQLEEYGFTTHEFKNVKKSELPYYREDQVVARELLVLVKS